MTETLDRAAGMAGTVADSMDGHMGSLRPVVESMRGQWEGTARVAMENAHARWETHMVRLCAAMRRLGESTQFSSATYTQVDDDNSAVMQQVAGMGDITAQLRA